MSTQQFQTNMNAAFLFLLFPLWTLGQNTLTLAEAHELSRQNYPLVKQRSLIEKSSAYTLDNAAKVYLPQISINGQATYQSDVTSIPLRMPGLEIPEISKDQYRFYAELNQPLYDGGLAKQRKKLIEAGSVAEEKKLEVSLYAVRDRVDQLYFGILMSDARLKQVELLLQDLEAALKKTEAAVANGVALKTSVSQIKAEALRAGQKRTEIRALKKSFLQMLGHFINRELDEGTQLQTPERPQRPASITRPELALMQQNANMISLQDEILNARNRPRLALFVQAGIGRPALNMLSNDFDPYYIGGLRLHWNLSGLYTVKKERAINELSRQGVGIQKELFEFNTTLQLVQQDNEIEKLQAHLSSDNEIIELRTEIKNAASAQLSNGVINTADYLREVNAEQQAIETRSLHEIQLLMAACKLENIGGASNSH